MASVGAYASQILPYNHTPDPHHIAQFQKIIPSISQDTIPPIAVVDLNEDGITEFIVKTTNCSEGAQNLCDYVIVGQVSEDYMSLGTLRGQRLILGQDYTNGVRNLLLFANPVNDFDYDIYVWGAKHAQYVLKSNE
jgi:hypothetical protein